MQVLLAPINLQQNAASLKAPKTAHILTVMNEQLDFQNRQDNAILYSDRYRLIIIDSAAQSLFGLPHGVTKAKWHKRKSDDSEIHRIKDYGNITNRMFSI